MLSRAVFRSTITSRASIARAGTSLRQNAKRRFCTKPDKGAASAESKAKVNSASPPPPPPSEGGSGNGMYLLILAALGGGAYYFKDDIYKQLGWDKKPEGTKKEEVFIPEKVKKEVDNLEARLKQAEPEKVQQQKVDNVVKKSAPPKQDAVAVSGPVDYEAVRKAIVELLDDDNYDDGSYGPVFVRLAWHNAGTYDKNTKKGGSEGAGMRFAAEGSWGANAGLEVARARLEPVKDKFPGITYSDLWSYAGTVALEEMGAPKMNWRPGRKDCEEGAVELPDGLLPDALGADKASKPSDHLRDIFYRMGFNDQEIVALSGGHAFGRCHPDRSGFWGPWTFAPTTFSNEYYRLLLEEKWSKKRTHKGKEWTGNEQYENSTGELMMLPTDMSLVWDEKMRPYVEKYAKDEELFAKDFAKVWMKLQEQGVKKFHGYRRYYFFGPRE